MSSILALLTAIVIVMIGVLRERKPLRPAAPTFVKRYVHPGHAWLRILDDGEVLVGIDDFAQACVGDVDDVRLPHLVERVEQGSVAFHLVHGKRVLPMLSPVTGWVIEKNQLLEHAPTLVNSAPLNEGWLFKVHPHRLHPQLRNLMTGKWAHHWQDAVRTQLNRFFSASPVLMYQDGGVMLHNLSDRCSDREWESLVHEYFLIDENPYAQHKEYLS